MTKLQRFDRTYFVYFSENNKWYAFKNVSEAIQHIALKNMVLGLHALAQTGVSIAK